MSLCIEHNKNSMIIVTVEPPDKGHFGNRPLVLCSEVVPISEVHDFSTHFDCIILNKFNKCTEMHNKSSRDDNQVASWYVLFSVST